MERSGTVYTQTGLHYKHATRNERAILLTYWSSQRPTFVLFLYPYTLLLVYSQISIKEIALESLKLKVLTMHIRHACIWVQRDWFKSQMLAGQCEFWCKVAMFCSSCWMTCSNFIYLCVYVSLQWYISQIIILFQFGYQPWIKGLPLSWKIVD